MRLLITSDTVGGVWRFGIELAEGLLEAGDAVALVSFGGSPSASQRLESERLSNYWKQRFCYVASEAPLEWMQQNGSSYKGGLSIIRQTAVAFGVDLLHSNQYCYGAVDLGVPVVLTAHSDVLTWAAACRGGVIENSAWLQRYRALVQNGLDGAAALVAPTRWMLHNLAMHFEVPEHREVFANGRKIQHLPPLPRVLRAVTAGRLWDEAKDISLLRSVQTRIPLIVAGPTDCDGTSTSTVPNVEYYGELSQRELMRLFTESAIYICTSRYEPFGLAPLEAAMCGCAVIARNIESLCEIWGDAALFFSDADELSNILELLAGNPTMLLALQQRAKDHAQRYTRERMVGDYRSLYTAVLEKEYSRAG